jgi:hypothetical protein
VIHTQRSLVVSKDLLGAGSAKRGHVFETLVYTNGDLHDLLDQMVEAVSPEDFKRMKAAHEAGHWVGTPLPPHSTYNIRAPGGCIVGNTILYKLQTGLHRNVENDWCAIMNDRKYSGGEAVFPDLGLKFMFVLFSSSLFS